MAHVPRPSYMGEPENQYGELDESLAVQVKDTRKKLLDSFNQVDSESTSTLDNLDQMRVYLRLRPFTEEELRQNEDQDCFEVKGSHRVVLKPPVDSILFKNDNQIGLAKAQHVFSFTKVFPPYCSQEDFFNSTTLDLIKDFVAGQNSLIFTYGVTNAGKTYTIQGNPLEPGIVPRALDIVFSSIRGRQFESVALMPKMYNSVGRLTDEQQLTQRQIKENVLKLKEAEDGNLHESSSALFNKRSCDSNRSSQSSIPDAMEVTKVHDNDSVMEDSCLYSVWVSFTEVYNEQVYDLLAPVMSDKKRTTLKLSEDTNQNIYVKGLVEIFVNSAEEAYQLLLIGQKNLKFASTKLNYNSSRSHCIFTMKLMKIEQSDDGVPCVKCISRLSFCDLAGSERTSKTENVGERVRETGNINSSLLTLGRCISALRWNQMHKKEVPRVIPFRDSKLTRLFQNFLMGSGRSSMIVNISQTVGSFDETVHVLKFSAAAKQVITAQKPAEIPVQIVNQTSSALTAVSTNEVTSREFECDAEEEELLDKTIAENPLERQYLRIIDILKQRLIEVKQKCLTQEATIREEVCREMAQQMAKDESVYSKYCKESVEDAEDLADERLELYIQTVQKKQKSEKRVTMDGGDGDNEDDEWVSSALLRAEEQRVKEREEEIEKLKIQLAQLQKEKETEGLTLQVPNIRRVQESTGSAMSVDSLDTGTSVYSGEDIERLQSTIENQKREMKDLKEMLKEAGDTFTLKETQLAKLETELKVTEEYSVQQVKVMQETQAALDETRVQLESTLTKLDLKETKIKDLEQQVTSLNSVKGALHFDPEVEKKHQKKVEQLSKTLREAELERDKLKSEVGDLNEQLSSSVFDCDTLRLHEQTLEEKIRKAEETVKSQRSKMTEMETQLTANSDQLKAVQAALEKADQTVAELKLELANEKSISLDLQQKEVQLKADMDQLTAELASEKSSGEEVKSNLRELNKSLEMVTAQLKSLANEKVEIEKTVVQLQDSLAAYTVKAKDLDTAKAEARSLHEELNETKYALTTARTEVIDLKRKMLDHNDEISLLKSELVTKSSSLRHAEETLASERKNFERIVEDHKRNEAVITELKKGLDIQDQVAEKSEAVLVEKKATIDCLTEEVKSLKHKELVLEKECQQGKQLRRDFEALEQHCEVIKKQLSDSSAMCNNLGVEVDNLRVELAKQLKMTEMKESQIVSLTAKVAALEKIEEKHEAESQAAKLPPVSSHKRRTTKATTIATTAANVRALLKEEQQQVDLTPSSTAKPVRSTRSSSRNNSPSNNEAAEAHEPPQSGKGKSTARRKTKKESNSPRTSSSLSSTHQSETTGSPVKLPVATVSTVKRTNRKRKSAACNTDESEPSGFAAAAQQGGSKMPQPSFDVEEERPQRSRRTAAATARDAIFATEMFLRNSPVGQHLGTIAKQTAEYAILGSPVADPVAEETQQVPPSKKKRQLYSEPQKKLSFSPVESASQGFVGFRAKDPLDVVQRQVKSTAKTPSNKRSTRAHSKATD